MIYWFSGMPAWGQLIPPAEIPFGKSIYTAIGWVNNLTQAQQGHVELVVTKPDGTPLALSATLNQDAWADPGSGWFVQFEPLLLNQGGSWRALVTLSTAEAIDPIAAYIKRAIAGSAGWDATYLEWPAGCPTLVKQITTYSRGTGDFPPGIAEFCPEGLSAEGVWLWVLKYSPQSLAPAMMSRRFALRVWRGDLFGIHPRHR